ncbi:hypothetical protein C0V77_08530 [Emticicia sp. TH156]|nr:hypothetical protein C0V77_08530 [Emticicia sp. TH156]
MLDYYAQNAGNSMDILIPTRERKINHAQNGNQRKKKLRTATKNFRIKARWTLTFKSINIVPS